MPLYVISTINNNNNIKYKNYFDIIPLKELVN